MALQPPDNVLPQDTKSQIGSACKQLLIDSGLPPPVFFEDERLKKAVSDFASQVEVPDDPESNSHRILNFAYLYAAYCVPYHPIEVKIYVAVYTWYFFLFDDFETAGDISEVAAFPQRLVMGDRQPSVFLDNFTKHLQATYQHYRPPIANFIISASCNFVTALAVESLDGYKSRTASLSKNDIKFPYFIRDKNGLAEGFVWAMFSKTKCSGPDAPIKALWDMNFVINGVNDVLSFYKEELCGDTDNYIHYRARARGQNTLSALWEVEREIVEALQRIESALAGEDSCLEAWRLYAAGFIQFHIECPRYRLKELSVRFGPSPEGIVS